MRSARPKTERQLQQEALIKRLNVRGKVVPAVCVLQSDPPEHRYAVRELTLDDEKAVVDVSRHTLTPKAGSSEELHRLIVQLIEEAELGYVSCGLPLRRVSKADLEDFELLIGLPVFSYSLT